MELLPILDVCREERSLLNLQLSLEQVDWVFYLWVRNAVDWHLVWVVVLGSGDDIFKQLVDQDIDMLFEFRQSVCVFVFNF